MLRLDADGSLLPGAASAPTMISLLAALAGLLLGRAL
jgi:hypothetical protein